MLRLGYLPSDFNPMLLVLGEAEDLRGLAFVLRRFARDTAAVKLHELSFCHARQTQVTLAGGGGTSGLHAALDDAGAFVWHLDAARATEFAGLVEDLATSARVAGSETLACGTADEVPVKVSRGEYTDDFLLAGAASAAVKGSAAKQ
jgi:hypothetical protein